MRRKYLSIKEKFFKELESAGIRISRRSKKFDKFIDRHRYTDFIEDYQNGDETNRTSEFDDYEYEDLHKDDDNEDDDYDRFQSISNMCDQIDWNVIQNQSSVYLLTTYMLSNKVVCSLSDVDPRTEYDHLCQYGQFEIKRNRSKLFSLTKFRSLQFWTFVSRILSVVQMDDASIRCQVLSVPVAFYTVVYCVNMVRSKTIKSFEFLEYLLEF